VGVDLPGDQLRAQFDAVLLCGGSRQPRNLNVPGRELKGVHFALTFLEQANRRVAGDSIPAAIELLATGKQVVVIGGGDTGSDCLGTSLRQGAARVSQLEVMPKPPVKRTANNPWPAWPQILRTSSSQEEGGDRDWAVATTAFLGDAQGRLRALKVVRVGPAPSFTPVPGTEFELPCDLALLAMGFLGSERACWSSWAWPWTPAAMCRPGTPPPASTGCSPPVTRRAARAWWYGPSPKAARPRPGCTST
jgi:glutamate synthase (NADPH/NADH) small chain